MTESAFINPDRYWENIARTSLKKNEELEDKMKMLERKSIQQEQWINDLQSGMYINCVYCGHRYGAQENTPSSMADILKEHIEKCPKHPMSQLKEENEELKNKMQTPINKFFYDKCNGEKDKI